MPGRLEGKVVIVTGAGSGIGAAIASKFAAEGARVVINGLPTDPILEVEREINAAGGKCVVYAGDVAESERARACVQMAIDKWGKLDILVSNAGTPLLGAPIHKYDINQFDKLIARNIRSIFLMTRFAIPHLQKTAGNIVATGNEVGTLGMADNTPYGGAKGFVHAFIKGVAVEQARYGIRANCVCPGPVDHLLKEANSAIEKQQLAGTPMGRRGTAEEIANVFTFLASDMASYVTGALWVVDGGTTIGKGPSVSDLDADENETEN